MAGIYDKLIEAFTILKKYEPHGVYTEQGIIYAGPTDPATVSDEDRRRLAELGWFPSQRGGFKKNI